MHSVSITAGANVNDEIHLQKYRSDTETTTFDVTIPTMLRSKSTIETSRDLKNRIKLTDIQNIKRSHKEAYGKRSAFELFSNFSHPEFQEDIKLIFFLFYIKLDWFSQAVINHLIVCSLSFLTERTKTFSSKNIFSKSKFFTLR